MEMDNEVVGLIRDRLESIDKQFGALSTSVESRFDKLTETLEARHKENQEYHKKVTYHEGQLSTLKWLFGTTTVSWLGAVAAWFQTKFGVR